MVKGISRQIILVHSPDKKLFEQAIFILRDDAKEVTEETLLKDPAWQSLTAVQEGRYYVMDPSLYNMKPNARWGEAYEILADILYP